MNSLLILFTIHCSLFTLTSCGGGDDDGRRLGDSIVGTWQRGYGEGDLVIDGETDLQPDEVTIDHFIFLGDGTYNGMIRDGSFSAVDDYGDTVYEGQYRCDNNNLKLTYTDSQGSKQVILAQVLMFTEDQLRIKYENESYHVSVTLLLRRLTGDTHTRR